MSWISHFLFHLSWCSFYISCVLGFLKSDIYAIVLWVILIETKSSCNSWTDLFYVKNESVILFFLIIILLDGVLFFLMADCTWKIYLQEIKSKEIHNILFSLRTKWNVSANLSLGLDLKQGKQWSTKYRNNFMRHGSHTFLRETPFQNAY